jgi:hypothetical protein
VFGLLFALVLESLYAYVTVKTYSRSKPLLTAKISQ